MPTEMETTTNDERFSYEATVDVVGVSKVLAQVEINGHTVECVARHDGATVWLDRACERATTPTHDNRIAFTDESVTLWHDHVDIAEEDMRRPAHQRALIRSTANLARARQLRDSLAEEKRRLAEREAAVHQQVVRAMRARDRDIAMCHDKGEAVEVIQEITGLSRPGVIRVRDKAAP